MNPAIRVRGLVKTYPGRPPVEAVRGLDLEVKSGECFGLLGPNGAGKTTTFEIIEGLLDPTAGEVEVLGMRWGTSTTPRFANGSDICRFKRRGFLTNLRCTKRWRCSARSTPLA